MILFNFALPGRFGRWCDAVIERLVRATGHEYAVETWPSYPEMLGFQPLPPVLDAIALKLIAGAPTHLAMGVRQPDERLLAVLSAAHARFVVALDDPRLAVPELVGETGAELGAVTRAVANCCPLLMRFAALPEALVLHEDHAREDAERTIAAIAAHSGFALDAAQIAQIAGEIGGFEPSGAPPSPEIPSSGQRAIDGALAAYADQFAGASLGRIIWRRELFIVYADEFTRPTGIIDIAGPPRTLIYGPYIHLPPGRWSARVVLGFSAEAAGSRFVVDAYADPDPQPLGEVVLVPPRGGVYSTDIDFSLERPNAKGIEIRILVTSDNARGQIAFGHVVLQPVAMRRADALGVAEDFESVLEL